MPVTLDRAFARVTSKKTEIFKSIFQSQDFYTVLTIPVIKKTNYIDLSWPYKSLQFKGKLKRLNDQEEWVQNTIILTLHFFDEILPIFHLAFL